MRSTRPSSDVGNGKPCARSATATPARASWGPASRGMGRCSSSRACATSCSRARTSPTPLATCRRSGRAGRTSSSRRSSRTSSRTRSSPRHRDHRTKAPVAARPETVRAPTWKQGAVTQWLVTLDHKRIGILYIVSAFLFFFAGGVMAILMRLQLAQPEQEIVTRDGYNQLFTIHGTTMVFLFVVPILAGFGNYLVPLMIGAHDMAFPRLNALSYWLFLLGGLIVIASFGVDGARRARDGRPIRRSRGRRTARLSARTSGSSEST